MEKCQNMNDYNFEINKNNNHYKLLSYDKNNY